MEWERFRFVAYVDYCMNSTEKVDISEFLPLMGDKIPETERPYTEAELAQKMEEAMQRLPNLPIKK